jgi:hypothetical protein
MPGATATFFRVYAAWEQWKREFARVMPPPDYVIEDVPLSDPMFHSMFEVTRPAGVEHPVLAYDRRREHLGTRRRIRRGALSRRMATRLASTSSCTR